MVPDPSFCGVTDSLVLLISDSFWFCTGLNKARKLLYFYFQFSASTEYKESLCTILFFNSATVGLVLKNFYTVIIFWISEKSLSKIIY